jgi:hypothetical protein
MHLPLTCPYARTNVHDGYTPTHILSAPASLPAALLAVINSKLPELGLLLLQRVTTQFKRAFKRNDKPVCEAALRFIAHLTNQQVVHEVLALEVLMLLLEDPISHDAGACGGVCVHAHVAVAPRHPCMPRRTLLPVTPFSPLTPPPPLPHTHKPPAHMHACTTPPLCSGGGC